MRSRLLIGVLFAVACKEKAPQPPPPGSGSGTAIGSGSAKEDPQTLALPRLSGQPPKKTSKPLGRSDFERLSKFEFRSFTSEVRKLEENVLNIRYKVIKRPSIDVTIAVLHCKECVPMDVAMWRDPKVMQPLKDVELAKDLQDAKDTTFEIGETTLGGQKLIYQYQLGWNLSRSTDQNVQGSYTHSYMLFHNDGNNEVRIRVNYADNPPASLRALTELAPRATLEEIALTFMDQYTQAWVP